MSENEASENEASENEAKRAAAIAGYTREHATEILDTVRDVDADYHSPEPPECGSGGCDGRRPKTWCLTVGVCGEKQSAGNTSDLNQPDRCPSMDPWNGGLQCTRLIHDDGQHHLGQIAWRSQPHPSRPPTPDGPPRCFKPTGVYDVLCMKPAGHTEGCIGPFYVAPTVPPTPAPDDAEGKG